MINLLQPQIPELGSFARGLASKRPNLWDGLVGAWISTLGMTGNILHDVSGRKNIGINNGATWLAKGELSFNGSSDNVDLGNKIILNPGGEDFSYFIVFKFTGINTFPISSRSGSSVEGFEILAGVGGIPGDIRARIGTSSTPFIDTGIYSSNPNLFHDVLVTLDRTGSGDIILYVDGLERQRVSAGDGTITNTQNVFLGKRATSFMDGQISSVLIYKNRALSPSEALDMHLFPNAMFEYADRFIPRAPVTGADVRKQVIQAYMRMRT